MGHCCDKNLDIILGYSIKRYYLYTAGEQIRELTLTKVDKIDVNLIRICKN